MSNKDPTPHADALRAMREQRYGHIQARADSAISRKRRHEAMLEQGMHSGNTDAKFDPPPKRKLIPFAGKETNVRGPDKSKTPRKRRKLKRKISLQSGVES